MLGMNVGSEVYAQQVLIVSGTVKNKDTREPFAKTDFATVMAFNLVSNAEAALVALQTPGASIVSDGEYEVGSDGYYCIEEGVLENGALIFKVDGGDPVLVKINGKKKIDQDLTKSKQLDDVEVIQKIPDIPVPVPAIAFDEWLRPENMIPVPPEMGKSQYRMIYQPFLYDMANNDTIEWMKAVVTDGREYHATQNRRMGFKLSHDVLYEDFSGKELKEGTQFAWSDSVKMPDPADGKYQVLAFTAFEDYSSLVYNEKWTIIRGIRRPFRHIDYNCALVDADVTKKAYQRLPKREYKAEPHDLNLTFLYASSQLDPENPKNETEMETLRSSLRQVLSQKGANIRMLKFIGVSSPEGNYAGNLALSRQRISTVKQLATQGLSRTNFAMTEEPSVASWEDVIPLIELAYPDIAQSVRDICNQYKDHDARSSRIMQLPAYHTVIEATFPQLRKVRCECNFEIFRKPNDNEIVSDFKENRKRTFTLYEYSRLFELMKDTLTNAELEDLYKDAMVAANKSKDNWALPANLLAISYMKRDTVDLNLLRPYINFNITTVNMANGQNLEEIVANQMIMYLKAFKSDSAQVLCDRLPDNEIYDLPKSLCNIRNFASDTHVFNSIALSCDLNYVIMNLAQDNQTNWSNAEERIEELDQDDALTWYFKAVANCKKGFDGEEDAADALVECWKRSDKLHQLADNDGDLTAGAIGFAEQLWKEYLEELAEKEAEEPAEDNVVENGF